MEFKSKFKIKGSEFLKLLKNILITGILLVIIGFVVYQVAQIYIPKIKTESERKQRLGKINQEIEQNRNQLDGIYEEASSNGSNLLNEEEKYKVSVDVADTYDTLREVLPIIASSYENKQFKSLYESINFEQLEIEGLKTSYDFFQEKQTALMSATKHEAVTLLFHDISRVGTFYICPVSIVGIKENTEMNLLYDYDNAIEAVFTVYQTGDAFTYLPFNIMFGKPVDSYAIIQEGA